MLDRLEKAGLRLKKEKCVFMVSEVVYIGHKITAEACPHYKRRSRLSKRFLFQKM